MRYYRDERRPQTSETSSDTRSGKSDFVETSLNLSNILRLEDREEATVAPK